VKPPISKNWPFFPVIPQRTNRLLVSAAFLGASKQAADDRSARRLTTTLVRRCIPDT
jgi:hypothetical protein